MGAIEKPAFLDFVYYLPLGLSIWLHYFYYRASIYFYKKVYILINYELKQNNAMANHSAIHLPHLYYNNTTTFTCSLVSQQ